jgi:hypothetical protein
VTYGTPGVSKLDWPVLFTGLGVGQGIQHAFTDQDSSHLGTCPNFDDRVCPGLVMSGATGYPDATTLAFLRHASVSTYMSHIRIPTFLAQGENDTLFDLQEAAATYRDLRAQGTPVKMLWRSAGHSGGDIGNSENDEAEPEAGYESRLELEWLDYYLRGIGDGPPLDFSFFRDWQPYTGDAAPAVGETPNYPAATETTLYLSGTDALVGKPADVKPGSAAMAAVPGALTSTGGGFADLGATDAPGTSVTFTTPALAADTEVAGPPRVKVHLSAPTFAQSQSADPATKLVVFAKLYDLDPSGAATLPANLVSAARVADVTKPVDIELPGIVHHFVKGHQMQLVLTTSDATFNGNHFAGPVSVTVDPASQSTLIIPELGEQLGATGAGPSGTTRFTPPADDGPVQKPGAGGPEPAAQAAVLPSAATCKSRRSFRIRLRKAPRGDRLKSAAVTVNGKRVKTLRGKRLKAPVDLRGLPKGTFRVVITARTVRGRTLRSARTYRTCVAKRK